MKAQPRYLQSLPTFEEIYDLIKDLTLVDEKKLRVIYDIVKTREFDVIAEVGVYRGGTAKLIAMMQNCPIHLFDTFEGIPSTQNDDMDFQAGIDENIHFVKPGDFYGDPEEVEEFLSPHSNVVIHKGFFPDTTTDLDPNIQYDLVHLDGDIYQTTKDGLEYFFPKLSPYGIIICDDFTWPGCPGVDRAIWEFLKDKPQHIMMKAPHQCIICNQGYHKIFGTELKG